MKVHTARVTPAGFEHDRRFMIVDDAGRFVSQRDVPSLRALHVAMYADEIVLHWQDGDGTALRLPTTPNGDGSTRPVTIWDDAVDATPCGDEASAFLASRLGPGYALVTLPHAKARPRSTRHVDEPFHASFADGYPFLIANDASRRDLESRIGIPLMMERFRPNVVIDGLDAWAEDHVTSLRMGEVTFDLVKACVRCVVTTLDPEGGPAGREPLATLATFRRSVDGGVTFGMNAVARNVGMVRVGDTVDEITGA